MTYTRAYIPKASLQDALHDIIDRPYRLDTYTEGVRVLYRRIIFRFQD